jgi:succinyl-CoA synthetase beta subunit
MMLLEHHAKELLRGAGVRIPDGFLVNADSLDLLAGDVAAPCVVKAQVPVGGRGKAGGIVVIRSPSDLEPAVRRVLGMSIRNHPVRSCRIESMVDAVSESYFSLAIDADSGSVVVLAAATGGVDIESPEMRGQLLRASAEPDRESVLRAVESILPALPEVLRGPIDDLAGRLTTLFFEREAMLVEINPLFTMRDGGWVAGDAKILIDDNALPRQPALRDLIETNPDLYPEAALKLAQGFDFVRLDPDGDIGLVTTGAGLSMQLVDEIVGRGHHPFNFCDIRTGGFRGDPSRLVQVLKWVASGPQIRAVLMNFFAGNTNLAELVPIILAALKQVPELRQPITLRMIGNGLDQARAILAESGNPIFVETDLERAVDHALADAQQGLAHV